jgi:hypothetical protein
VASQSRQYAVGKLARFVKLIDGLTAEYEACIRVFDNEVLLASTEFDKTCIRPVAARMDDIDELLDESAPLLDVETWSVINGFAKSIRDDHTCALVAYRATVGFEDEFVRSVRRLCFDRKAVSVLVRGDEDTRQAGRYAIIEQLRYYFILRDFLLPGLEAAKAIVLAHARKTTGQAIPRALAAEANALASIMAERNFFELREPAEPFSLSVVKTLAARQIEIPAPFAGEELEEARWQQVLASTLVNVLPTRSADVDELVSCGVLKPEVRGLASQR